MSSIRVTRGGDVFRLPCNDTDTLLALLRRAGCTLPAACGGHGRCGKCRVSVNGVPRLACRVVPEDGDEIVLPPAAGGRILTETLDPPAVPTGETGCAAAIDLGTTTTALRLYDLATGHALATIGPEFEHHPAFPEGVNTEFVYIESPTSVVMRVWERGSGETFACGTGSCATVAALVLRGVCPRNVPVDVHLLGGILSITITADDDILMTGPAETAFVGCVEV